MELTRWNASRGTFCSRLSCSRCCSAFRSRCGSTSATSATRCCGVRQPTSIRCSPASRALTALIACAALLAVALKLFTAEVRHGGEPTVSLIVRAKPSLENYLRLTEQNDLRGVYVVVTDENDYVGSGVYAAVTSWGWGVAVVVLVVIGVRVSARRVRRNR